MRDFFLNKSLFFCKKAVSFPCFLFRYMIYYLYQKRYKVTKMGKEEIKKVVILRILEILAKYSGEDKPLTQGEIVSLLEEKYGLISERKAVGRSIECLRSVGYRVEKTTTGVYLSSQAFSSEEAAFLVALVKASDLQGEDAERLIAKIEGAQGARFVPKTDGENRFGGEVENYEEMEF